MLNIYFLIIVIDLHKINIFYDITGGKFCKKEKYFAISITCLQYGEMLCNKKTFIIGLIIYLILMVLFNSN